MLILNGQEYLQQLETVEGTTDDIEDAVVTEIADIKTETDKIPAEIVKTTAIQVETDKIPGEVVKTTAIQAMTDKIGTVVNAGGTATLGAILGDFANSALVARVENVQTAIDTVDGLHDVPTANLATDVIMSQVIGKKSDTVAGTSLVAIGKQLLEDTNELLSNQEIQLDHIHGIQRVYPTLANGVTIASGNVGWALSAAFTEIVPAAAIGDPFDIHFINVEAVSDVGDVYEVHLYSGAISSEVEIGMFRAYREANQSGSAPAPMLTAILPSDTRISAKAACEDGGEDTITIAIYYHTY